VSAANAVLFEAELVIP